MISHFCIFKGSASFFASPFFLSSGQHKPSPVRPWLRAIRSAVGLAALLVSPAMADEDAGFIQAPPAMRSVAHEFPPPPAVAPEAAARLAMGVTPMPARDPYIFEKPHPALLEPGPGEEALARRAIRAAATFAAPGWIVPSRARTGRAARHVGEDLQAELRCLALNVYWEARSESPLGRMAVAAVTLNRVANRTFPASVCEVVLQGQEQGLHRCQFSWVCDRRANEPSDAAAWREAELVAFAALFLNLPDPTRGALWYHADYVSPPWAASMAQAMRIGRHLFYRGPARTIEAARGATG